MLAGGGSAGQAWEIGLVAGLAEGGVDLVEAELVVGTSAGSTVAAQLTSGTSPADLYAGILDEVAPSRPADVAPGPRRPSAATVGYLGWSDAVIASARDAADMRRRMGAAALELEESDRAGHARWREVVAARLPSHEWPDRRVWVTAVDARSGEPVVFDRDSGVGLVDAVAASTSARTPHHVGEERFINGGYRRSENADLAAGYGRVVVLSPFGGRSRMPAAWRMDLASQVAELRAGGSRVEVLVPDAGAGDSFDANAMDPAARRPAARGGHDQGLALAASLADLWG